MFVRVVPRLIRFMSRKCCRLVRLVMLIRRVVVCRTWNDGVWWCRFLTTSLYGRRARVSSPRCRMVRRWMVRRRVSRGRLWFPLTLRVARWTRRRIVMCLWRSPRRWIGRRRWTPRVTRCRTYGMLGCRMVWLIRVVLMWVNVGGRLRRIWVVALWWRCRFIRLSCLIVRIRFVFGLMVVVVRGRCLVYKPWRYLVCKRFP